MFTFMGYLQGSSGDLSVLVVRHRLGGCEKDLAFDEMALLGCG